MPLPTNLLMPWPDQWGPSRFRKRAVFVALFFLGCVLVGPFYTASAWAIDSWYGVANGAMLIVGSALLAAAGLVLIRVRRRYFAPAAAPRGTAAEGLEFCVRRARRYLLFGFPIVCLAGFVVRGVTVARYVSSSDDAARTILNWLQLVLMVTLAVLMVVLIPVLRTLAGSRLVLTPDCIALTDIGLRRELSWSDIESIYAESRNDAPVIRIIPRAESDIRYIGKYRRVAKILKISPRMLEVHDMYPVDFALLLHAIGFYTRHPEARGELRTHEVVGRLMRGDVLT
ncbi:hypothetical protein [Nocardia sp. SSK8]|uniref:hypothetical protein n=1 Tax=Nocardia sp. SSK8 TaxID=3120154 RepID=UPI0030081529